MTQEQVVALMKSSKNSKEWDDNCDIVKKAHNDQYPSYWYKTMIISGLINEILGPGNSEITIR